MRIASVVYANFNTFNQPRIYTVALDVIPHIAKPLTSQSNGGAEKLKELIKTYRMQMIGFQHFKKR